MTVDSRPERELSTVYCPLSTESGGVAQLGERLLCKQEVIGSIPFTSTIQETVDR